MPITLTVEIPDATVERITRAIMDNFPEASATLQCREFDYERCHFRFRDMETAKVYDLNLPALTFAVGLMFTDKWPKGCTPPPRSAAWEHWDEWLCQADATDFDAFVQLAALGEVIYG